MDIPRHSRRTFSLGSAAVAIAAAFTGLSGAVSVPAFAQPAEAQWLRNMADKGVAIPLVVLPALLLALSARKRLKNKSLRK